MERVGCASRNGKVECVREGEGEVECGLLDSHLSWGTVTKTDHYHM